MTDRYERTRDAEAVAWFPTNAQGEIIRNYGDGSPVYAYRTKEEAEQAKRCHLGATGPVIPLYAAPQQEQAAAEDMGGFTSDTAALAFLHLIGNGNPNVERAVERLRQSLIAQQPAAVSEAMELVRDIAGQKPEKPDYWSSCGQCESNIGRAQEVLEAFIAAQQTAAVGTKPLSEFMAEQEVLYPGIRDKVQAAADELRASLARQPAAADELIERLRSFVAERGKIAGGSDIVTACNNSVLRLSDLRALLDALEAAREDAERYRCLRAQNVIAVTSHDQSVEYQRDDLDAAIDRVRGKETRRGQ